MVSALGRGALVTTATPTPRVSAQSSSAWMPATGGVSAAMRARNSASLRSISASASGWPGKRKAAISVLGWPITRFL